MRNSFVFVLVLALFLNISYAKRKAMIVGVQNYDAFAPLESCHGDVDDMKELLMQGGFEDDHIWALKDAAYGETLTASKLFSNVNAFARGINEGDEVIFFFSGHGIGGSDGNNYLMGSDGNIENPEKYGSISVEEIKRIIKEKKPSEAILIIDACRSFVKKEDKGIGNQVSSNMNIGKGIKVQPVIQTGKATNQGGKTIVKTIYAASEGQQSFERKDKNNGAFTYYMTYLLDSPNSAMDIDGSKDGIITIEDLILFADNRINDWTKSQGLTPMNPVYQTEGGITYEPFMLFRYNAEKVVEEQKKEGSKPIFQYDEKAELEKIKKFTENKEYLNEELPVYQPKVVKDKKIEVDNTDLSSWELALAQEKEIQKSKDEEARKEAEAKDKENVYNELRSKYNYIMSDLDKTEDIFQKYEKLEKLRSEVNSTVYPEVKQKILVLLEPLYLKIKDSKTEKQNELESFTPQFEKDISDMEKMVKSDLSDELKQKYLEEFKKKWHDYAKIQRNAELGRRFYNLKSQKDIKYEKFKLDSIKLDNVVEEQQKKNEFLNKKFKSETIQMEFIPVYVGNSNSKIKNDFYISKFEISQKQYKNLMNSNPSKQANGSKNIGMGDNFPEYYVSWIEAVEFCNKLSELEGLVKCYMVTRDNITCLLSANGYRLPTEAEWMFAANGGNQSKKYKNIGSNNLDEVAWYEDNSDMKPHQVGTKKANELGIHDMSGNVCEWCTDPAELSSKNNTSRILKGGSWNHKAKFCSAEFRETVSQDALFDQKINIGFRIVKTEK